MTDFTEHFRLGVVGGILLAAAAVWITLNQGYNLELALKAGGLGFGIVVIGSVIPDIDHHASIPRRYLGHLFIFGAIAAAVVLVRDAPGFVTDIGAMIIPLGLPQFLQPGMGGVMLLLAALVIALLLGALTDAITTHRGITHSVGFALLFGGVAATGIYYTIELPIIITLLLGCLGAGGVLIHTKIGDR